MSAEMHIWTTFLLLGLYFYFAQGACTFKKSWSGRWFQSGVPNPLLINATHIESKGECFEEQADKYLVYDKTEDCYRCMAIHEKHFSVLQYKETFCEQKASLSDICYSITGDAPLYSMFRKHPESQPVSCPFRSAPFTFSYSRGSGECVNPPSKAESCTDDSRLVLKYQACPDVSSTESNVEELVCLATWKEGSTKYLVGKVSQLNRRNLVSDEDQYRCFIYQRDKQNERTVYSIAQSGDATCNGLLNAFEGSRTITLTTVDNHHNRCKFPKFVTDHHTWLSLDHKRVYKFTQKNASLKILNEEPPASTPTKKQPFQQQNYQNNNFGFQQFGFESQDQKKQNGEQKVICHSILESQDQKKVQIVAHVTAGCDSGYVCMVFFKRDSNVIEIQQTDNMVENADDACATYSPSDTPFTTLITTNLHTKKCPNLGKFVVTKAVENVEEDRRKKREHKINMDDLECESLDFEALSLGCNKPTELEFKTNCMQNPLNSYVCHGNWKENNIQYVITSSVSKRSEEPVRYCFAYSLGGDADSHTLRLSSVSESCHRHVIPGVSGAWAYNFTSAGGCSDSGDANRGSSLATPLLLLVFVLATLLISR